jgi:hypothetical protein
VVPERDRVGPGGKQPLCEARGDADAVGHVLAVDDAELGLDFGAKRAQSRLESIPPGSSDDIGDEKDVQSVGDSKF